jgi:alpha-beta hydrolase superfamily lysophospholipase
VSALRIALALAAALTAHAPASAAAPAAPTRPSETAAATSKAAPAGGVAIRFPAAEGVVLQGEWFAGPPRSPSVVLAPRRRGVEPELRDVALEFQRRGFGALTFSLRDPAPESRESDSLRYAVLLSRWVEDMVGALRAVRLQADSTLPIYAWGQGLGGALVIAASTRAEGLCDAVAVEDVFPSVEIAMRLRGTLAFPEAIALERRLLSMRDDPQSAATRMRVPLFAILVGSGAGGPDDLAQRTLRQGSSRTDRWLRPGIESPAPAPGAAQVDTLARWFRQWGKAPPPRMLRSDTGARARAGLSDSTGRGRLSR